MHEKFIVVDDFTKKIMGILDDYGLWTEGTMPKVQGEIAEALTKLVYTLEEANQIELEYKRDRLAHITRSLEE